MQTTVRRLRPGDEEVVRGLAEDGKPQTALIADERTIFVAAFDGDEPVGFAFGYLLPRRHGEPSMLFVYELDVVEGHRRRGIATRLMEELFAHAGGWRPSCSPSPTTSPRTPPTRSSAASAARW
jgi:GNAT superfamily N-acetyltransferase